MLVSQRKSFLNFVLLLQIRDLVKNPPDGIRYTENDENSVSEIHAVIDGPGELLHPLSNNL